MLNQLSSVRSRSNSSFTRSFSSLSRVIESESGLGRWSSSKIRVSSDACRSFRASIRVFKLMDWVPPFLSGSPASAAAGAARNCNATDIGLASRNLKNVIWFEFSTSGCNSC